MKQNHIRLSALLLILVLTTASMVGGTFAKYTASASGSATARVAKWSFTVGDKDIERETFSFNLFDTINDTGNTTAETDVASGKKIAPGTAGKFQLNLENKSEVSAEYTVKFRASTDDVPLQYSLTGRDGDWKAITDLVSRGEIAVDATDKTAAVTVYWKWAFEDNTVADYDTKDTALGIAAQAQTPPQVTVTATVTATQVD